MDITILCTTQISSLNINVTLDYLFPEYICSLRQSKTTFSVTYLTSSSQKMQILSQLVIFSSIEIQVSKHEISHISSFFSLFVVLYYEPKAITYQ